MRLAGILPEDDPDPRIEQAELLKLMPVPVIGFVPQPALEDTNTVSLGNSQDDHGYCDMTVGISYTLWRNPDDRSDPVNLAELDEQARRAIEYVPPWPRPAWLLKDVARMRYPMLWEAVRTTWNRDVTEDSSVRSVLVRHVNDILMNQFRRELRLPDIQGEPPAPIVTGKTVNSRVSVLVNGVKVPGGEIDTDPFVYGIGAALPGGTVVTAAIPRRELDRVRIEFSTRT